MTLDPGHMKVPWVSHHVSKTTQTELTSWSGRCYYQGADQYDGGSRLTIIQKQQRQNEPAGQVDVTTGVEVRLMMDSGHV